MKAPQTTDNLSQNLRIIGDAKSSEKDKQKAAGELALRSEELVETDQLRVLIIFLPGITPAQLTWLKEKSSGKKDFFSLVYQSYLGNFNKEAIEKLPDPSKARFMDLFKANLEFENSAPILDWMAQESVSSGDIHLKVSAIQTLAHLKSKVSDIASDAWFASKSPEVRSAAVESLISFCPSTLWNKLDKIALQEESLLVLSRAIDILPYLQNPKSELFLQKLMSRNPPPQQSIKNRIEAVRKDAKTTKRTPLCGLAY